MTEFHPPATTPKSKKARPIPRKLKICLEAILEGKAKNMAEGARIAGCTRQYVRQALNKRPDVIAWVQQRAAKTLGLGAAAAAAKMLALIYSDSSRTAFESSRFVLGLSGLRVATDPNVNINLASPFPRAGYLIDLRGRSGRSPLPDVTIEPGAAGAVIVDGTTADDVKVIEHEAGAVADAKPVEAAPGIGPDWHKPD